jgi:hypothetical protein
VIGLRRRFVSEKELGPATGAARGRGAEADADGRCAETKLAARDGSIGSTHHFIVRLWDVILRKEFEAPMAPF